MLTLIIGGSGSGKSSFGEELAQKSNSKLYYLATMIPYGDEGKRRVERHLKLRKGKGFETIEEYMDIGNIDIPYGSCVLLEDLPNLVANNMFTKNPQKDINMFIVNGIVQLYNKVENMILSDINLKWKHNFQSDERQQPSTGAIWMKTGEEN